MIYLFYLLAFSTLSLTTSAPVDKMSPFLRSMIGTKAIKSGDIPLYSTKPAQISPVEKRDTDSDALHYMIQTTDEMLNITLYPNRKLLSRNFIVQQRTDNGSLQTVNVPVKNCYYTGSVDDHHFSRVVFSVCNDEMKGIIETDDDMFVMEPADKQNKEYSHVAHKIKRKPVKFENKAKMDTHINGTNTSEGERNGQKKHQSSSTSTIELMVYIDARIQNDATQNGFSVIDYILGIINTMARLYRDPTLQHQIDLTLARLILESVNGTDNINIMQDISSTLNTFCSYQQSINTPNDSSPLHFDHAILITNVDLCQNDGNGSCSTGVFGYAPIGGMCSQSSSCTINQDTGFSTAFILAHKIGQNLGMQHDGANNACGNSKRIMAPSAGGQAVNFLWSSCSAAYLQAFLSSGKGGCLEDVPAEGDFDSTNTVAQMNRGWSEFGPYSPCSRTCGGGVRYRERQCNNPTFEFDGSVCPGSAREYDPQLCNTNKYPQGSPSFRSQQCAATNNHPFYGIRHTWKEYTKPVLGVTPCQLVCISAEKKSVIVIRKAVVEDGTPCKSLDSPNAICVQGKCTSVGCDNVLESGAQRDSCGVCNGDDSGATKVNDTLTGSGGFGYHTVTVIPAGAHDVRIAETTVNPYVYLALQSQGQAILNGGFIVHRSSPFATTGNEFQYVRSLTEEYVFTPGPLHQELTIQALVAARTGSYRITVEYSMCNSTSTSSYVVNN